MRQAKFVADDIQKFFFFFGENKSWHFMWIQADDLHEMSRLIFSEKYKKKKKMSSAAVLIGTLRVKG